MIEIKIWLFEDRYMRIFKKSNIMDSYTLITSGEMYEILRKYKDQF